MSVHAFYHTCREEQMKLVALGLTLLFSGSCLVYAQEAQQTPAAGRPTTTSTKTPRVTKRQLNQQRRIGQGVKSGELTKGETRRLENEEGKIQAEKKMAKADGKVTPAERKKLRRDENKASKDIYRMKHNK